VIKRSWIRLPTAPLSCSNDSGKVVDTCACHQGVWFATGIAVILASWEKVTEAITKSTAHMKNETAFTFTH